MLELHPDHTFPASHDPWKQIPVKVRRLTHETEVVKTYDLEFVDPRDAENYSFRPGQFNMLYLPGVGEAAISIADRCGDVLRHTIHTVGSVTSALQANGVGTHLGLRGPMGRSWPIELLLPSKEQEPVDVILVAGGIGLAPLRYLVRSMIEQRNRLGDIHLLIGARTATDLLYQAEYHDWREQGIDVQTTVDRASNVWGGQVGVVTLLLERLSIARPQSTLLLTCGPEVMMRYVARSALGRGLAASAIWLSLERNMNCAIGLCGHCQLGTEILCRDGPVFRFDRVHQLLGIQDL